ncbi:hypothetical protein QBC47DRAFT_417440 [Echria macrotheca]|uniref:Uncharacterized protein n=1 Tax=Echria macrotheca TaxID=438768 RepID=A0AAJ0B3J0_9PEZI|nr:hypothetical protein QBC47DRAFT_417440 [Echria macrotheca]
MVFLRGVKDVIKAAGLNRGRLGVDLAILLDWVYYYDVLAYFSLRYWKRKQMTALPLPSFSCVLSESLDYATFIYIRAEVP